jgi:hypothetical protein
MNRIEVNVPATTPPGLPASLTMIVQLPIVVFEVFNEFDTPAVITVLWSHGYVPAADGNVIDIDQHGGRFPVICIAPSAESRCASPLKS